MPFVVVDGALYINALWVYLIGIVASFSINAIHVWARGDNDKLSDYIGPVVLIWIVLWPIVGLLFMSMSSFIIKCLFRDWWEGRI